MFKSAFLFILSMIILIAGCASTQEKMVFPRKPSEIINPEIVGLAGQSVASANEAMERNKRIEDDPKWIEESYKGVRIQSLRDIPERDYEALGSFLDNGTLYIIVHPFFYPFFHTEEKMKAGPDYRKNVVDGLLELTDTKPDIAVIQAFERRMRDFIEIKSTEKKLILFIFLKDYRNYSGYIYKDGQDEYARYMNEITNDSESVLYVESRSSTRGALREEDMLYLLELLAKVNPKSILLGGSYLGRCLEDFYVTFTKLYGIDNVYVVPELSVLSPREIRPVFVKKLLQPDGSLNVAVATENIKRNAYQVQERIPNTRNLP
jgi:hypothetical protein